MSSCSHHISLLYCSVSFSLCHSRSHCRVYFSHFSHAASLINSFFLSLPLLPTHSSFSFLLSHWLFTHLLHWLFSLPYSPILSSLFFNSFSSLFAYCPPDLLKLLSNITHVLYTLSMCYLTWLTLSKTHIHLQTAQSPAVWHPPSERSGSSRKGLCYSRSSVLTPPPHGSNHRITEVNLALSGQSTADGTVLKEWKLYQFSDLNRLGQHRWDSVRLN